MNAYLGIFRMRFIAGLQYRAAAWAGVATQFFWGFMQLMVFAAFFRSAANPPPMPFEQLSDYIWLRQAFLALVMLWSQDLELLDMIASGAVGYELVRPYRLYAFWFARLAAVRLANTALRFLPIMIVTGLLPEPYRFHLPPDAATAGWFLLSLALALALVVAASMFIYLATFVTLSPNGARLLIGVAGEFLMGAVIPVPFMPDGLRRVVEALPFRYMADLPFRIYSGGIAGAELQWGLLFQAGWIALLVGAGCLGFRLVQKRVVIQGG